MDLLRVEHIESSRPELRLMPAVIAYAAVSAGNGVSMVRARSIGQRAANLAAGPPTQGRVLAVFGRVWDLVTDAGDMLAVTWDGVPNGPFNILLDHKPGSALPAGTRFVLSDGCVRLAGPVAPIELTGVSCWDPHPAWTALAASYHRIRENLPVLASVLTAEAPKGSLADLCLTTLPGVSEPDLRPAVSGTTTRVSPASADYAARATGAISAVLAAGHTCDAAALRPAVAALCGLGPGLTPAGDDWLAGWLLALRLIESAPDPAPDVPGKPLPACATAGEYGSRLALARASVRSALSSTTILSGAFLKCACEGEVDANWHALLCALANGTAEEVQLAVRRILAHGATSGADMLAGFLAGQPSQPGGRPRPASAHGVNSTRDPMAESRHASLRSGDCKNVSARTCHNLSQSGGLSA